MLSSSCRVLGVFSRRVGRPQQNLSCFTLVLVQRLAKKPTKKLYLIRLFRFFCFRSTADWHFTFLEYLRLNVSCRYKSAVDVRVIDTVVRIREFIVFIVTFRVASVHCETTKGNHGINDFTVFGVMTRKIRYYSSGETQAHQPRASYKIQTCQHFGYKHFQWPGR